MSVIIELKREMINHLEYLAALRRPFQVNNAFLNQLQAVIAFSGILEWTLHETGEGTILLFEWQDSAGWHKTRLDPSAVNRDLLIVEEVLES